MKSKKINMMELCRSNKYNCTTCAEGYKNFYGSQQNEFKWYCGCGGHLVNENYVCLDYRSK